MRSPEDIARVLELARNGASQSAISRATGISRTTVRTWLRGRLPVRAETREQLIAELPGSEYAYLLGVYLGDGAISHGARASALRISCDARYPGIIDECVRAIRAVRPDNRVSVLSRAPMRCVVVQSWSKWWPQLFPQAGEGRKHTRPILLADWQRAITGRHPRELLRGLIHSDGSRFTNRVRYRDRDYLYPRYAFSNRSEDIKAILCEHLDLVGIAWRRANAQNISIARREAVAALDTFIGPKR